MSTTTKPRTFEAIELLEREEHDYATTEARKWSRDRGELATNLCYAFRSICKREGIEDFSNAVDWHEATYSFRAGLTRHIR